MASSKIHRSLTFVDTDWIVLQDLSWAASGAGKFYAQVRDLIPSGVEVKAVTILDWGGLTESINVQPSLTYGASSILTLLSNTNSFSPSTKFKFRILY